MIERKLPGDGLLQNTHREENTCIELNDDFRGKIAEFTCQSLFIQNTQLMAQRYRRCIQTTFSLIDLYASRQSCTPEICREGYRQDGGGKSTDDIVLKDYHGTNARLFRTPCRVQVSKPDFASYRIQRLSSFLRSVE